MNIEGLRNERSQVKEWISEKKILINGLEEKLKGIESDRGQLIDQDSHIRRGIDVLDGVLESDKILDSESQLEKNKEDLRLSADLLEATEKRLETEKASLRELQERISGIDQKIRLAIASREEGNVRVYAHPINRAIQASILAGSFTSYEDFFSHTFGVNSDDLKVMAQEFESEVL